MSSYELRDTLACTFRITYFLSLGDIRYLRVDRTTPDCPKPFPLNFHTAREDEDRETKGEKTDRQIFFFFSLILFEKSFLVEKLSSENTEKIRKFYYEEAAFTLDAFFSIKMLRIIFKINAYIIKI